MVDCQTRIINVQSHNHEKRIINCQSDSNEKQDNLLAYDNHSETMY